MDLYLNIIEIVLYLCVASTFSFSFLLFFSRKNSKSSRWLALVLMIVAINYPLIWLVGYTYIYVSWFYITRLNFVGLLIGPFFYYYVHSLLSKHEKLNRRYLLPALGVMVYDMARMIYVAFAVEMEDKMSYGYIHEEFLVLEFFVISTTLFCFYKTYEKVKEYRSVESLMISKRQGVRWLERLTIFAFMLICVWMIYYIVEWFKYPDNIMFADYFPLWIGIMSTLIYIGTKSLLQPELQEPLFIDTTKDSLKYQTSSLTESDAIGLAATLNKLMEEEKYYLSEEIDLQSISQLTGYPTHHISQALNQGLNQGFYNWVNSFRVQKAIELIEDPHFDKFTIQALAFEAGFNSRNAFYKAFKKETGKTPKEFRKAVRPNR